MNTNLIFQTKNGFKIYRDVDLAREVVDVALDSFQKAMSLAPQNDNFESFGRGQTLKFLVLDKSYILRTFRRGGLVSKFNKNMFMSLNIKGDNLPRPFIEHQMLNQLREAGIHVPSPVLSFVKPKLGVFYQGAILMRELLNSKNLLSLLVDKKVSSDESFKLIGYVFNAGKEANKIIRHGILHADLHPGNVLIVEDSAFIIDFDKAEIIEKNEYEKSKKFLVERWERAILKRIEDKDNAKKYVEVFKAGVFDVN